MASASVFYGVGLFDDDCPSHVGPVSFIKITSENGLISCIQNMEICYSKVITMEDISLNRSLLFNNIKIKSAIHH